MIPNTNYMKQFLPLLISGSIPIGCKGTPGQTEAQKQAERDSFSVAEYGKP